MKKKFLAIAGVFGVAILAASFNFGNNRASATVPGTNTLVSMNYSGTAAANGGGNFGMMSASGKFVVFSSTSSSSNVVSGSTRGGLFERNLSTSTITEVDLSSSGVLSNGSSIVRSVSETGRYVLFNSTATNLIDGSTESGTQLYLRDTETNTTTLISQNSAGT